MLSKSNAREVANCRLHLKLGNHGAYARGISALHRAASKKQQDEIARVIVEDDTHDLFRRYHDDRRITSVEVFEDDPELVLVAA